MREPHTCVHPLKPEAPRYLRFVAALVLGSAAAVAPVALGGCDDDTSRIDAAPPDGGAGVDGPLHPPDLPRAALVRMA